MGCGTSVVRDTHAQKGESPRSIGAAKPSDEKAGIEVPASRRACESDTHCVDPGCRLHHTVEKCADFFTCSEEDCKLRHGLCKMDSSCHDPDCRFRHSVQKCSRYSACTRKKCKLRHPKKCPKHKRCDIFACELRHPAERVPPCGDGKECMNATCSRLHPSLPLIDFLQSWKMDSESNYAAVKPVLDQVKQALAEHEERLKKARQEAIDMAAQESTAESEEVLEALKARVTEMLKQRLVFHDEVMGILELVKGCPKQKGMAYEHQLWREVYRLKNRLPALAQRAELCEKVRASRCVVVRGQTGSGKSTQIPQYLCDMKEHQGKYVICTQPRKIAAVSLANRVSMEYAGGTKVKVGQAVGYQVSGSAVWGAGTRIVYMTEGTLLDMLVRKKANFKKCAAVVLDEAHERSLNLDVLLGLLKRDNDLWRDVKLVVTSATIDVQSFSDFLHSAPIVEIPGRLFPVEKVYCPHRDIDDAAQLVNTVVSTALRIHSTNPVEAGDILCFLTGQEEVERAKAMFDSKVAKEDLAAGLKHKSLALFGKLQPEQQQEVFKKLPADTRKIVFATDIAETSITIDGISFVVDCGLCKGIVFDSERNMSTLKQFPISQSAAQQRAGRCGRTGPGTCFRLYSEDDFRLMSEHDRPEIFRRPLALAAITLASMNIVASEFEWISAPPAEAIQAAEKNLEYLGAVERDGGQLRVTKLGRLSAELQLDPAMARIIWDGCESGLGEAAIAIVALLGVGSMIYYRGQTDEQRQKALGIRRSSSSDQGDTITMFRTLERWCEAVGQPRKPAPIVQPSAEQLFAFDSEHVEPLSTPQKSKKKGKQRHHTTNPTSPKSPKSPKSAPAFPQWDDDMDYETMSVGSAGSDGDTVHRDFGSDSVAWVRYYIKNPWQLSSKWCSENFVNTKALSLAWTTMSELRQGLRTTSVWSADIQSRQPTDEEILQLSCAGLFMNVAVLVKGNYYQSVLSQIVGHMHPGNSLVVLQKRPKLILYSSILRTNNVMFVNCVSTQEQWVLDQSPAFREVMQRIYSGMQAQLITFDSLHPHVLRGVVGRNFSKLEALQKELDCTMEVNMDKGTMSIWCTQLTQQAVRERLTTAIETIKEAIRNEFVEEVVSNDIRAIFAKAGRVEELLFGDEFVTVLLRNIPPNTTEAQIHEVCSRYGRVRCVETVLVGQAGAGELLNASVTYFSKSDAEAARAAISNELWPGSDRSVMAEPGGIRNKGASRGIAGKMIAYWSLSPSLGEAVVAFRSPEAANATLRAAVVQSHYPEASCTPIGFCRGQKKAHKIANLPPLTPENLFEEGGKTNIIVGYNVKIKGLPEGVDEVELQKLLQAYSVLKVAIRREPTAKAVSNERLLEWIACLNSKLSFLHHDEYLMSFINEAEMRAGFSVEFPSVERALEVQQLIQGMDSTVQLEDGTRVRLSVHFSGVTTLRYRVAEMLKPQLDQLKMSAAVRRVAMKILEPKPTDGRKAPRVIIRFSAEDNRELSKVMQMMDTLMESSVFNHPRKLLLFSTLGRKRLAALAKADAQIFWDKDDLSLHFFGSAEKRSSAEQKVTAILHELEGMQLDKVLRIRADSVESVRQMQEKLTKVPGIANAILRKRVVVLCGTEAGIREAEQMLAGKVWQPRPSHGHSSSVACCICYGEDGLDGQLKLCGHGYHLECVEGMFGQGFNGDILCPQCAEPLAWSDVVAICPQDKLHCVIEGQLSAMVIQQKSQIFRCPKDGCSSFLKTPHPTDPPAMRCAECASEFCYPCSTKLEKFQAAHPGQSCAQVMMWANSTLPATFRQVREDLNVRCPRCRHPFIDFNGCLALTCHCGAGFCGLCQQDCGSDAHEHVRQCPLKPPGSDAYFMAEHQVLQIWAGVRRQRVIAILRALPDVNMRREALQALRQDLQDVQVVVTEQDIMG